MNSVIRFLSEVKLELSRVIWPKRDEWIGSTVIVLFLITVFAIYLFFVDKVWSIVMKQIFSKFS